MNSGCAVLITVGLMTCLGSHASDGIPLPNPLEQQRHRIIEHRTVSEATFLKAQQACAARFAVSDCVAQVRRERRAVMDELRRQEIVLNDLDRQAKATVELERLENNQSPEHQQVQEFQRQQALQRTHERQVRSNEKKAVASKLPEVRSSAIIPRIPDKNPDEAPNLQHYTEKLMEAQQRKADKVNSLKDKGLAKSLPAPAGL